MDTLRFGPIRYNAALGAFEARVDVTRGSRTFRYPARLNAPISLPPETVRDGLARDALRMSDSGDLRSVL